MLSKNGSTYAYDTSKVELEIDLELPPYCKAETDDQGNKTYKLGTEEVSISDYINEGCCTDVDTSQLSEAELEVFEANCGGEDIVDLKQECGAGSCEGNNGTLPAKNVDSYVKQVSMKGTMDKVYKWEIQRLLIQQLMHNKLKKI